MLDSVDAVPLNGKQLWNTETKLLNQPKRKDREREQNNRKNLQYKRPAASSWWFLCILCPTTNKTNRNNAV